MCEYSIVFVQGNKETVIGKFNTLEEAENVYKTLQKDARYIDGFLTVEYMQGNRKRIRL